MTSFSRFSEQFCSTYSGHFSKLHFHTLKVDIIHECWRRGSGGTGRRARGRLEGRGTRAMFYKFSLQNLHKDKAIHGNEAVKVK